VFLRLFYIRLFTSLDLFYQFYFFNLFLVFFLFLSLFLSFFQFFSSRTIIIYYVTERLEDTRHYYLIIRCTLIPIFSQTMAATKRNAGLTSAVPRATLNDEELVRTYPLVIILHHRVTS